MDLLLTAINKYGVFIFIILVGLVVLLALRSVFRNKATVKTGIFILNLGLILVPSFSLAFVFLLIFSDREYGGLAAFALLPVLPSLLFGIIGALVKNENIKFFLTILALLPFLFFLYSTGLFGRN